METDANRLLAKKPKLSDSRLINENNRNTVKMRKPVAVLAEKYTRLVDTVPVYVADLRNPKQTSKCIRELKEMYPLQELQHLKRVRRKSCKEKGQVLQILIANVPDRNVNKQNIAPFLRPETCTALGQPYVIQVPKHAPLTRQQFNEASKLWPASFHEDKYITKIITGELFSDKVTRQIYQHMSLAVDAAKKGKRNGMVPIGAVVVDPATERVIAIAHDLRRQGNLLQHAVMVVIDMVAQDQSGGAWCLGYQEDNGTWVLSETMDAAKQPMNSEDVKSGVSGLSNNAILTTNMSDQEDMTRKDKTGPYLCTGYDLYITREPCVMCAMALVHSRIRRVFYGCKDHVIGALGSKYSLHVQQGLNHHYEVFTEVLQEECLQLMMI